MDKALHARPCGGTLEQALLKLKPNESQPEFAGSKTDTHSVSVKISRIDQTLGWVGENFVEVQTCDLRPGRCQASSTVIGVFGLCRILFLRFYKSVLFYFGLEMPPSHDRNENDQNVHLGADRVNQD